MKTEKIILGLVLGIALFGCQEKRSEVARLNPDALLNQALIDELREMAELDQVVAYIPQGKYKDLSDEEWQAFKKNTYETHHKRLEELFQEHGFIGFDKAGQDGSNNFWLLTQHCDHAPEFQLSVLEAMKAEVEAGNANPAKYAMLVDRVNLNLGKKQVYGTQVAYNHKLCQAFARNLANKEQVNSLRKQIGLEPLEAYLNSMSNLHFEMNKESYAKQGITEPTLYPLD